MRHGPAEFQSGDARSTGCLPPSPVPFGAAIASGSSPKPADDHSPGSAAHAGNKDHHEAVDAKPGAARRRDALLEGLDENLVVGLSLLVAARGHLGLRLQAPPLLGAVAFGEG